MADHTPLRPPASPGIESAQNSIHLDGCLLSGPPTVPPVAVSMRIFQHPHRNTILFRLRTTVQVPAARPTETIPDTETQSETHLEMEPKLATEPDTDTNSHSASAAGVNVAEGRRAANQATTLYLHILSKDIHTMSIDRNIIHFRFKRSGAITLIVPARLAPFHPTTVSDSFAAIGLLTRSLEVHVRLPTHDTAAMAWVQSLRPRLAAICSTAHRGCSGNEQDSDPSVEAEFLDRGSLFRGGGGREVDVRAELLHQLPGSGVECVPPAYSSIGSASHSPACDPGSPVRQQQKRPRTASSSEVSPSASIQRTIFYRDPQKIDEATALLQRLTEKEQQVHHLLRELDKKITAINRQSAIEDLRAVALDKKSIALGKSLVEMETHILALDRKNVVLAKKTIALDKKIAEMDQKMAIVDERRAAMDEKCARMSSLLDEAARIQYQHTWRSTAQQTGTAGDLEDDYIHIPEDVSISTGASPCSSDMITASQSSTPLRDARAPHATGAALPPPQIQRYITSRIDRFRSEIEAHQYATERFVADSLDVLDVKRDDNLTQAVNEEVDDKFEEQIDVIERRVIEALRESLRESLA